MPEGQDNITVTPVIDEEALKVGARHSSKDIDALQKIHDGAVELGAVCATPPEVVNIPILGKSDELIAFGTELKALDNGHFGGYLVRFSDENTPDITGDFFTKATDFGELGKTTVYFNHRMPIKNRDGKQISIDHPIGEGELSIDDAGVFIDAILYSRDEYEKSIAKLSHKMGWSSGTAPHLVDREQKGGAMWIKRWPLGLDASITPTPAEPKNSVIALKSLSDNEATETETNSTPEVAEATAQTVDVKAQEQNQPPQGGIMEINDDLKALLAESANQAVKAYIATQPVANPGGVSVVEAEEDKPFETAGQFFKAVKSAALAPYNIDPRLQSLKAASGLNEAVPSQGGFLVPSQVASGILQNMYKVGTVLSLFAPTPVEGNGMIWNVIAETSRADGSRMGGVAGYWLAEAGDKTASKPAFRQLEVKLNKLAALCYATDELLEDASALGAWLASEVPNELRFMAEDAIINGNGVGKPLGILASGSLKSATRTDASEIDPYDLGRMWAGRYNGANDYVWLVNPTTFPQLVNLSVGNLPVFLPPGGVSGLPYGSIFGRPVYETEYNPALGTLGDILLVSPSQYKAIHKGSGVQAASSIHVSFTSDQTCYRFVYRVGGAPLWYTTLTGKDSQTYSPFVALAATT